MLKILRTVPFFAPAYGYGGPVVHTLNVSKIQASLGYDVRVFTTNILTNDIISMDLPRFEVIEGIKVHRHPIKFRLGKSHYFITPQLPNSFIKYDYDIIHSHSFRTFQTDIASIFAKIKKKPFILTAHGTLRKMYLLNLFKTKNIESKRMKLYDFIFKKLFLEIVDRVIVHSNHEKLWTLEFNVPEEKIRVIPHGVNIKEFSNLFHLKNFKNKYSLKKDEKMILYVGRLLRNYRNLEHLILVMKDIAKEIQNVKLWIIGHSYDKKYEIELKRLVKKHHLIDNIKFVLSPTRYDIIGAYQAANLIVFPITNSDGFGIPLIEAGASKKPVISINQGPAPELIKNGKTGILIRKNNLLELKDAILKILIDKELERKMGYAGFQNVINNFTWEIATNKINEIYNELI